MSQTAAPSSLTATGWTGTLAGLSDSSDATYLESPSFPTSATPFVCRLSSVNDPGIDTSHYLRARVSADAYGNSVVALTLQLENSDDSSVVATGVYSVVPNSFVAADFLLTSGEAAAIHSYGGLQIRGWAWIPSATYQPFVWDARSLTTRHQLQVGTAPGTYNLFDADVGNVLTYELPLPPGTYYSRVRYYAASSLLQTNAEQTVTVP